MHLFHIEVVKSVRSRPATGLLGGRTTRTEPDYSQVFEVKAENVEFFGEGLLGGVRIREGKHVQTFGKGQIVKVVALS